MNNPIIIDVEASGFGSYSYLIEIGVAMDDGERSSWLIQPGRTGLTDYSSWPEKLSMLVKNDFERAPNGYLAPGKTGSHRSAHSGSPPRELRCLDYSGNL
jgi:hypothetical protein